MASSNVKRKQKRERESTCLDFKEGARGRWYALSFANRLEYAGIQLLIFATVFDMFVAFETEEENRIVKVLNANLTA